MKRLLWTLSLLAGLCAFASAQELAKPSCPTLEITGPAGVTAPGGVMPFVLTISDPSLRKLTFSWTVSAGTIVEGQGSRVIKVVAPAGGGTNVTATVEVTGLPNGCARATSSSRNAPLPPAKIASPPPVCDPDSFGQLSLNEEKLLLQDAALRLRNRPDSVLYIIKYLPQLRTADKKRIAQLSNFLQNVVRLKPNQFKFVTSTAPIVSTMLYVRPNDGKISSNPCSQPST